MIKPNFHVGRGRHFCRLKLGKLAMDSSQKPIPCPPYASIWRGGPLCEVHFFVPPCALAPRVFMHNTSWTTRLKGIGMKTIPVTCYAKFMVHLLQGGWRLTMNHPWSTKVALAMVLEPRMAWKFSWLLAINVNVLCRNDNVGTNLCFISWWPASHMELGPNGQLTWSKLGAMVQNALLASCVKTCP